MKKATLAGRPFHCRISLDLRNGAAASSTPIQVETPSQQANSIPAAPERSSEMTDPGSVRH